MAHIKCRYIRTMCACNGYPAKEIEHDRDWFCDSNLECPEGKYTPPVYCDPPNLVNPDCVYLRKDNCEFEKDYKRYEYFEDGGLTIGRKWIPSVNIQYLEIDNRVLIENWSKNP